MAGFYFEVRISSCWISIMMRNLILLYRCDECSMMLFFIPWNVCQLLDAIAGWPCGHVCIIFIFVCKVGL